MAKPIDPKAKERKQKIILAVGGVLLLGLLAFQLPKLMKGSGSPPSTVTSSASSASPTSSAVGGAPLVGSASFAVSKDKLVSFTLFKQKDPFVQLVSASASAAADGGSSLGTSAGGTPVAGSPAPGTATVTTGTSGSGPLYGTVGGTSGSSTPGAPAKTAGGGKKPVALPGAMLKVNGTKMRVQLGDTFPKAKPIFRLAGITGGGVQVAIVKGGLADGSAALTVQKHHPLTLVNTADNHRYTIAFLSSSKT